MKQVASSLSIANYSMPEDILAAMNGFKDYTKGLQDDMLELHSLDQQETDRALDMIKGCADDGAASSGGREVAVLGLEALSGLVQDHRLKHEACRSKQAALASTWQGICQAYNVTRRSEHFTTAPQRCSSSQAADASPDTLETFHECLRATHEWAVGLWAPYQACLGAKEEHHNKKEQCDALQGQFESSACHHATKQGEVCICHKRAVDHFEALRANFAASQAARQHIHATAVQMDCYIDVLVSNDVDKKTALHHCKELSVDTSHLEITYGSVPTAAGTCSSPPPCSESWVVDEYSSRAWHDKATTATCTPCETITVGTPTPTPARRSGPAVVTDVYFTFSSFMALNKNTGQAMCWGPETYGGACSGRNFIGVTDVYSTDGAFFALSKNAGKGQCWGHASYGGSCSDIDFAGVTDATSNDRAFVVLNKNTGKGHCWGSSKHGGDCSSMNFAGFTNLSGYGNGFLAWSANTGRAQCWGWIGQHWGPDCSRVNLAGITDIASAEGSFVGLNKNTGEGLCWGSWHSGGSCGGMDFTGMTDVYSTDKAFMALSKTTGKAQCWGNSRMGGSCSNMDFSGFTDVVGNYGDFVALNKDAGEGHCWGSWHDSNGGCRHVDFAGVTDVYAAKHSGFMALNKDTGKAQCWGSTGLQAACDGKDLSRVTDVYGTYYGLFMALDKNTGQFWCLAGHSFCGDKDSFFFESV
mmetsp:Transcript_111066/g.279263  ORF Transcript_111066/g.279263 Transcript_111066/m.279263 type:complete len:698 (-) Transcript_111066:22-2115(-)